MNESSPTRADLIDHLTSERPIRHRLYLNLGGVCLEICVNEPALGLALEEYFAAFRMQEAQADLSITALEAPVQAPPIELTVKQRAPGKKPHEAYADLPDGRVVQKFGTDMLFVFGHGDNLVIGPCLEWLNQVVNFVGNRLIERLMHEGGLPVHVAAGALGGQAMAFTGKAGKGKSTLALHMTARGADFVTNDRAVLLGRNGEISIHGEPKTARVNPGTALNVPGLDAVMPADDRERFRALPTSELWSVERKYTAPITEIYGPGRFQLTAELRGLLFLEWSGFDAACRIEPVGDAEREELMGLLRKSPGLFYFPIPGGIPATPPLSAYLELLSQIPMYTARGGVDFNTAASFCLETLGNCR
jgi:HprK-related kinase B